MLNLLKVGFELVRSVVFLFKGLFKIPQEFIRIIGFKVINLICFGKETFL